MQRSVYPSELKAAVVAALQEIVSLYTLLSDNPIGFPENGKQMIGAYSGSFPTESNTFQFEMDIEAGSIMVFYSGMSRPARGKSSHAISIVVLPPAEGADIEEVVHKDILQGVPAAGPYAGTRFLDICFSGTDWSLRPAVQVNTIRDVQFPLERGTLDLWRITLVYEEFMIG